MVDKPKDLFSEKSILKIIMVIRSGNIGFRLCCVGRRNGTVVGKQHLTKNGLMPTNKSMIGVLERGANIISEIKDSQEKINHPSGGYQARFLP
jgi:hypothetical protein